MVPVYGKCYTTNILKAQSQRRDAAVCIIWLAVSINTSNSYGNLELRSRRLHFDLVYFENLERRIKCLPYWDQNIDVDVVEMKPPTRLHQIFEVDEIEVRSRRRRSR